MITIPGLPISVFATPPTVGSFTAPYPDSGLRGYAALYDYCMDDTVSNTDAIGLWSKANFDESKVKRYFRRFQ